MTGHTHANSERLKRYTRAHTRLYYLMCRCGQALSSSPPTWKGRYPYRSGGRRPSSIGTSHGFVPVYPDRLTWPGACEVGRCLTG